MRRVSKNISKFTSVAFVRYYTVALDEMPVNASLPKDGTSPKKVTIRKLVQPSNAFAPIDDVTEAGITIDVKWVHSKNAL